MMMRANDPTPHDEHTSAARREREKSELQKQLVESGKAIDTKAAMLRCYGGEPGTTEEIIGEGGIR